MQNKTMLVECVNKRFEALCANFEIKYTACWSQKKLPSGKFVTARFSCYAFIQYPWVLSAI